MPQNSGFGWCLKNTANSTAVSLKRPSVSDGSAGPVVPVFAGSAVRQSVCARRH